MMRLYCEPHTNEWKVQERRAGRWVTVATGHLWQMAKRWRQLDGCDCKPVPS